MGAETGDDAAVYQINEDTALIATVDFFPPITDDPYEFGAIAAANSLSDVYAMGGRPLLALNVVGFPASLDKGILGRILQGGYAKAAEAECLIAGGHTVDDPEPKYGLSVIGVVTPGQQVSNAGAQPGDALVLSKPIGTGIITTAGKQGVVDPEVMAGAVATMAALNRPGAVAMTRVGVNAATDITGFGLMGHLKSMVKGQRGGRGNQPVRSTDAVGGAGAAGAGGGARRHAPECQQRGRRGGLGRGAVGCRPATALRRADFGRAADFGAGGAGGGPGRCLAGGRGAVRRHCGLHNGRGFWYNCRQAVRP